MNWKTYLAAGFAAFTLHINSYAAQTRIIGGTEIDIPEAPWQVAILSNTDDLYQGQYCGGTLVHARWVITAAHCLTDVVDESLITTAPTDVYIAAGMADLITPESSTQLRDVSQVIVHPSYNPITTDYDIALLELAEPIDLETCGSACATVDILTAAQLHDLLSPSTDALISGWGNTSKTGELYASKLQSATIQVKNCANSSYPANAITPNMFCAGIDGNVDSCQGDSGGPLVVNNADDSAKLLAGIVSWGNGCAQPGYPGIYTNVAKFSRWIYTQTAGECCSVDNRAPSLSSIRDKTTAFNTTKTFRLYASDSDNDALTFSVERCPEELTCTIDRENLTLSPATDFSGQVAITVAVSDGMGGSDTTEFFLTVYAANALPVLKDIPDQTMRYNETLHITLTATDADKDDQLTYVFMCTSIECEINGNILTISSFSYFIGHTTVTATVIDSKEGRNSVQFDLNIIDPALQPPSKSGGSLPFAFMLLLLPLLMRRKTC
jgi:secreted trypsin-like serine protease